MSSVYFEAKPEMPASRLITEVALCLQDKHEAYVYCKPEEGDAVEALLKRPFVAHPDLSNVIKQQPLLRVKGELEEVHEKLWAQPQLLRRLLNKGSWSADRLPDSLAWHRQGRRDPEGVPSYIDPEIARADQDNLNRCLNGLIGLLKRDLWRWYARHVELTRLTTGGRELFYFELRESVTEYRIREMPF